MNKRKKTLKRRLNIKLSWINHGWWDGSRKNTSMCCSYLDPCQTGKGSTVMPHMIWVISDRFTLSFFLKTYQGTRWKANCSFDNRCISVFSCQKLAKWIYEMARRQGQYCCHWWWIEKRYWYEIRIILFSNRYRACSYACSFYERVLFWFTS